VAAVKPVLSSTRRAALWSAAAVVVAHSAKLTAKSFSVRLGGPIYLKSDDPQQLAEEHLRLGYRAAYCPALTLSDGARIRATEQAFKKAGVVIAEVGAWKNMLDPDAEKRKANIEYVRQRLALADEVGALTCVDIAGSYNPTVWYGPHPNNRSAQAFDEIVTNVRAIIDAVKPKRSKFSLEMMGWALPTNADDYLKLMKAIERPAFGVHVDVCNCINSTDKFYDNGQVTKDIFSKLGRYVVSCHAKDVSWIPELQVRFQEVIPGRGSFDYRPYLSALARLPQQPPLMMEHLANADQYLEGATHIRNVGRQNQISFQ
jgi:sugar phosphate isomerase/epimerase